MPSRKPSVIVDARALLGSGIGRYLREVLTALLDDERFSRVILVGDPEVLERFLASRGPGVCTVEIVGVRGGFYSPRTQLDYLRQWLRGRLDADIAFFPHYDAPLALPCRSVVTIHDLTHFKLPEMYSRWKRAIASAVIARVVKRAVRVLADSDSTRRDLVEKLPSAAPKMETIPLGVGEPFVGDPPPPMAEIEGLRPYLLFVGNRKPHKNLAAAVETLSLLSAERPELKLVVAGRSFEGWEDVLRRAEVLGVRESIVEMNDVDDHVLHALYAGCEALLFPSFYEGFGLPVLEAMASGAPVVSSNRASLPEVVGDAGVLLEPDDHEGMADAVRRLARETPLREELRRRGRERAEQLSWSGTAQRVVDVLYREATAPQG